MATAATKVAQAAPMFSVRPTRLDQLLAAAAGMLAVVIVAAIARGRSEWGEVPTLVWAHIGTILLAVSLTPTMLLRRRGDMLHRRLGWIWVLALTATALLSFFIRGLNQGSFSLIHILSIWTLIQLPLIVWHARNHRHNKHRAAVRGMVIGALLIAGFFTFPFERLMGHWLVG